MKRSRAQMAALMKQRRTYLGLSAAQAARNFGVSSKTYREWEAGDRSVQAEYLPTIARVLCVSVRDLADALVDIGGFAASPSKTSAASVAA
jgi:transcriptional regulator with XRE-family HTH domain